MTWHFCGGTFLKSSSSHEPHHRTPRTALLNCKAKLHTHSTMVSTRTIVLAMAGTAVSAFVPVSGPSAPRTDALASTIEPSMPGVTAPFADCFDPVSHRAEQLNSLLPAHACCQLTQTPAINRVAMCPKLLLLVFPSTRAYSARASLWKQHEASPHPHAPSPHPPC